MKNEASELMNYLQMATQLHLDCGIFWHKVEQAQSSNHCGKIMIAWRN